MKKVFYYFKEFTAFEWCLWLGSTLLIASSFLVSGVIYSFNLKNALNLVGSLIGVTSLIFMAKGKLLGLYLMLIFCTFYGYVSFMFKYYGEMITYVCMSLPATVMSIISWTKNRTGKGRSGEVKVATLNAKILTIICLFSAAATVAFYFILKHFNAANLVISTLSVTTSFFAASLSIARSPFYAVAYAVNDVVLIVLWTLASLVDLSYLPMIICFVTFLFNDCYGFASWIKRGKAQRLRQS